MVTAQRKKRVSATRGKITKLLQEGWCPLESDGRSKNRNALALPPSARNRQGNDRVCLPIRSAMALRMSAWSIRRIDGERGSVVNEGRLSCPLAGGRGELRKGKFGPISAQGGNMLAQSSGAVKDLRCNARSEFFSKYGLR